MADIWLSMLQFLGQAWWVEISTETPRCTYYFGPFSSKEEAEELQAGYVEDLEGEGATNIQVTIKRAKPDPDKLTIYDEEADDSNFRVTPSPVFSGQM